MMMSGISGTFRTGAKSPGVVGGGGAKGVKTRQIPPPHPPETPFSCGWVDGEGGQLPENGGLKVDHVQSTIM